MSERQTARWSRWTRGAERREVLPRVVVVGSLRLEAVGFGGTASEHQVAEGPDVDADVDHHGARHVVGHARARCE